LQASHKSQTACAAVSRNLAQAPTIPSLQSVNTFGSWLHQNQDCSQDLMILSVGESEPSRSFPGTKLH